MLKDVRGYTCEEYRRSALVVDTEPFPCLLFTRIQVEWIRLTWEHKDTDVYFYLIKYMHITRCVMSDVNTSSPNSSFQQFWNISQLWDEIWYKITRWCILSIQWDFSIPRSIPYNEWFYDFLLFVIVMLRFLRLCCFCLVFLFLFLDEVILI